MPNVPTDETIAATAQFLRQFVEGAETQAAEQMIAETIKEVRDRTREATLLEAADLVGGSGQCMCSNHILRAAEEARK